MAYVKKMPNGRWQARYRDGAGKEHSRRFDRKTDADGWIAVETADLVKGEWIDPKHQRVTVGEWAQRWRATIVDLEPATVAWYEAKLRNHVLPRFASTPLGRLDRAEVRTWVADMNTAGAGVRTIQGSVVTLSQIMALAVEAGAIRVNPCQRVRLPRATKREMAFLTAAEVDRLAEATREPYGTLVRFAAYSGLRAGEIGGLRVGRLDLLRRRVDVREALKEVNGSLHFGQTKNHESRSVFIPRQLCDELAAHLAGKPHAPGDLVFTAPEGGPLRHNLFYRRTYKPAVVKAGLPDGLRFHDLRHTCAALLIGQGHQQYEIMRHLGHSSISVTCDTYGHLFPERAEAVADTLEAVWKAAR